MHTAQTLTTSRSGLFDTTRTRVSEPARPWLVRVAPAKVRTAFYYRFYRHRRAHFSQLYDHAALEFAPSLEMSLCPTDEAHSEIAFTGFYEQELSRRIAGLSRDGGLMVDAGANYGYFSLIWANGSRQNRVLAFEASPLNQSALHRNITTNHLESRIQIHPVALGAAAGRLPFWLGNDGQTGWGGFSQVRSEGTVDVPVMALDSVIPASETVHLLKIDVEGADTWVLLGARKLLEQKRVGHIFFEQNRERMAALGIDEDSAREFLESLDYVVTPLGDGKSGLAQYYARPNV